MATYAQSKMAVVLYTRQLARKLAGHEISVVSMTPGMVRTNLGRDLGGALKIFLTAMSPFMKSAKTAGELLVQLATSPELDRHSGVFFKKGVPAEVKEATDSDASRIWDVLHQRVPSVGGTL